MTDADRERLAEIEGRAKAIFQTLWGHAKPLVGGNQLFHEDLPWMRDLIHKQAEQLDSLNAQGNGHEKPCYYCGKTCDRLAANPSEWPIPLCHSDDPGKVKFHHIGCVSERLAELDHLRLGQEIGACVICWTNSWAPVDPAEPFIEAEMVRVGENIYACQQCQVKRYWDESRAELTKRDERIAELENQSNIHQMNHEECEDAAINSLKQVHATMRECATELEGLRLKSFMDKEDIKKYDTALTTAFIPKEFNAALEAVQTKLRGKG